MPQAIGSAIGLFLFNAGAPIALANFFVSSAGTALIGVGLAAGASAAAGAFRPGAPSGSAAIKPSDGQLSINQAVPPRWKSYGLGVRLAGPVWWLEADANGILHIGHIINHGRIGAYNSFHIDDAQVTLDGSGNVTTAPYDGVTSQILKRLGAAQETKYSEILTGFDVDEMRGDGVATILGRFANFATSELQFENYPNGRPQLRVTIDGSVVWDARKVTQSRTDETTWTASPNPIVNLQSYLLDPDGHGMPFERISPNLAEWKAEMDLCDQQVLSNAAGGFENRYRMAGTLPLTDRPRDAVSRFLSTCDGRCWQKLDGSIGVSVGVFRNPTVTIRDRDILDYELASGEDKLTAIAGVRAQYMSPNHDYREQDAEPWPDGETVLGLSEERVANLDLLWVNSHSQARRLMKRTAIRAASPWRGFVITNLAGLKAKDERFIKLEIDELDISESFEVGTISLDLVRNELRIEVVAVGPEIDEFDPATEEGQEAGQTVSVAWNAEPFTVTRGWPGYSLRQIVSGTDIVAAGGQARLRINSGTFGANLVVTHVSIVPRSGATDDGTEIPTEVTFSGGSGFSLAQLSSITSDWITFPIAPGTDYLVIMDVASGQMGGSDGPGGSDYYLKGATQSWDQQTVSGFTLASATFGGLPDIGVSRIEVRAG